jgi:adenylate kinase
MDSGSLVPDEVVLDIVKNRINQEDCQNGFILDGFPRNEAQGEILEKALKSIDKKVELVLNFEIDDEEVVKRISGRFFCKECGEIYNHYFKKPVNEGVCDVCKSSEFMQRSDDNEDVIRNRLKVYHQQTKKLIEFYEKKDLIFSFNAVKSSALLLEELLEVIKNK